ncbi:MAG: SDR family oxidoreductase [Oscillospiraceae bacterium]|jgi:NAD(P)-dependent dehydrogenase (short-subunit alcohol dehydrogenase family)|nr:SDR family oxidoreductase [Oscillospiraceae bacterium]
MKLEKKVAFVTGASSGMGHAIALLFAKEGAEVIAVARRKDRLDALVADAAGFAGHIHATQGDVADAAGIAAVIDASVKQFGKLDILVNCAGVMDEMMPAGETTDELWDSVLAVNLKGPFILARAFINQVPEDGQGVIVNIASIGGLQGSRAGAAYTASKHGVIGLTKNIAFMYAGRIRANAVAPGGVNTEIGVGIKNPSPLGAKRASAGMSTNPRMGEAEEIANAVLFLASDDSSFINGTTLVADAGWTAY